MVEASFLSAKKPPTRLIENASLFLDFDGTLVEIAESPDAVRIDKGLRDLMQRLHERLEGRLAIISGRPARQIWDLLGSGVMVVGSHGMEFLDRNLRDRHPPRPPALTRVGGAMEILAHRHPGVVVENKPYGVALHYRLCPTAEEDCVRLAGSLAEKHGMQLQAGKMMIEVRAPGGDKGTAIRTLMREPPMIGTIPLFMGDDLTDEPGFAVAAQLGGAGILIGESRPSAARYALTDVEETLAWLEAAAAKIE